MDNPTRTRARNDGKLTANCQRRIDRGNCCGCPFGIAGPCDLVTSLATFAVLGGDLFPQESPNCPVKPVGRQLDVLSPTTLPTF